jgi:hypothetical protein
MVTLLAAKVKDEKTNIKSDNTVMLKKTFFIWNAPFHLLIKVT